MTRRVLVAWVLLAGLAMTLAACGDAGGASAHKRDHRGSTTTQHKSVEPPEPTFASTPGYLPSVKKPNILVIEADDMRVDELKFMPNVRKLIGARGIDFENSFAPYPLCCPSRASFLSGEYAHNHGVLSHVSPWGFQSFDDSTTIATVLKRAGYNTAMVGKYLNGYASQHIHDSTRSSRTYVPPGWTDWMAGSDHFYPTGTPLHGGTYNYFSYTQVINGHVVPHRGKYSTDVNAAETRSRISAYGKRKKPWFIWWTPTAPHYGSPREPDDPKPQLTTTGSGERFETPARPNWVKGRFDKQITHALGQPKHGPAEADLSDKPEFMRRVPEMDKAEKKALTEVSRQRAESIYVLDRQVGVTLKRLQRTGQWKNTIVMFTSDNGYFLGEHRKRQGKILAHEPSLRVPLLIAGPGIRHGRRYDPVTTIDLAPTFAAYAGTSMPRTDGISVARDIDKGDVGWSAPVVTEGRVDDRSYTRPSSVPGFGTGLNTRGVRTARWKYTKYSTGEVELYDLKNDPLELQGKQDDPAYAGIERRLDAVWRSYINCKGAACDKPMPADLRATPAQERAITDAETKRTDLYYSDYPENIK